MPVPALLAATWVADSLRCSRPEIPTTTPQGIIGGSRVREPFLYGKWGEITVNVVVLGSKSISMHDFCVFKNSFSTVYKQYVRSLREFESLPGGRVTVQVRR